MATRKTHAKKAKKVEDYRHADATRLNNPPAGLAWQDVEKPPKVGFEYDPHLDPQLTWAGKAERLSFEVEAPSIHVHERLSTEAILRAVQKEPPQLALFGDEDLDRTKTVEFYQHEMGWVNRLILGDSLVVMASLLERERLGGRVQMIYVDPPYGINYNSNFQARLSKKSPRETADDAITREPEQVQAFRDTWELGVHSYLTYLRDRLFVARDLLADSGSLFVQIGPDRLHLVRLLLDEVFGAANAGPIVTLKKTSGHASRLLPEVSDFLLWYAKDKEKAKFHQLFDLKPQFEVTDDTYGYVLESNGIPRNLREEERGDLRLLPEGARVYKTGDPTSDGFSAHKSVDFDFAGKVFNPGSDKHWKLRMEGMRGLADAGRLEVRGSSLWYRRFLDDFGATALSNIWTDTSSSFSKRQYIVQTVPKIIERAMLMTTDPGDLVLDPTSGSATSAWVAEKNGRRWIAVDTSRVAVTIGRERLLTAKFDYYKLRDEGRGVDGGFSYQSRERVTMSSIGYGEPPATEVLYDKPVIDNSRIRVAGPFTFEALSRYAVNPTEDEVPPTPDDAQASEAQDHVKTLLDALRKQGIPRKNAKPVPIDTLDPVAGVGAIQAEGTYTPNGTTKSFAVSLGPRFGPITFAQIDDAMEESGGYDLVVFAGFAATPEAQQVIAKGKLGKREVALLAANPDLLVGDLLKNTTGSQTFRLFSAPEAKVKKAENGDIRVKVLGVDSFDAATGEVVSRSEADIAAWFLDQDYDGIVFHVNQAFFPRTDGWEALQKALKATVDPELMEQLQSFESLAFTPGENRKAAIRVVDDSGTTSEAVLDLG
ncbi:MAG: site-specific DNA-methyltransferase [Actinomycetota bacterium]|nr:site-specific DNA-methyltransferase [Actinomycetota bacterium]